jgi:colanic acid biosynthesis glycosyl transferase WcaI
VSRILVWSPNYAPELTGIPPLVTDACDWLAARGHSVEVITAFPNYPERTIHAGYRGRLSVTERRGGVHVERTWLRVRPGERFVDKALYELSFAGLSAPRVARRVRRADVLLCLVPSLSAALAGAALVRTRRPRTRLVVWVQDLVLRAASTLPDLGPTARRLIQLAGGIEAAALRAADRVVVCSPAFSAHATDLGVEPSRIRLIYNWVDLERIAPGPPREHTRPIRFLYAGNLGYTQGFETLIDAARLVGDDIRLEIVGAGNVAAKVRQLAAETANVRVSAPVPDDQYPDLLASADVHVVIQRGVSADANFPSKIASSLASGRPVVASISADSAAASVLSDSGGALVVAPDDPVALADAMRTFAAQPGLRRELGLRGRAYAEETFDREGALTRLERALTGSR